MISEVRGALGSVRYGYLQAAQVTDWTITRDPDSKALRLAATVASRDAFRLSQRPLAFVATHAKGAWRWPIVELQDEGASLRATLGPKE